jgi:hypothetical protein
MTPALAVPRSAMTLASLTVDELAQRCAAETGKFARREAGDDRFCFELLRRALADGVSEAFTRAYQIYERRVLGWVLGHSRFAQTGESADYFVSAAWSTFYFALRGAKFAGFPSLAQALAYLKLCVHTTIAQYIRDQRPAAAAALEDAPEAAHTPDLGARAAAGEIWRRIERALPDEQDRLLARCVFAEDLMPRQVIAAHPGRWRDERAVSLEIYRIRRALRNDAELRRLLGLESDAE